MRRHTGAILMLLAAACAAPGLQISRVESSRALVIVGELMEVTATLDNPEPYAVEQLAVDLTLPPGWEADPVRIELPAIAPFTTHALRFRLRALRDTHGEGRLTVTAAGLRRPLVSPFRVASCQPLATPMLIWQSTQPAVAEVPEDGCVYVATGSYLLFLPRCGEGRGAGLVYLRRGRQWDRIATLPALGRIVYTDVRGIAERWVYPQSFWIPPRDPDGDYLLTLRDEWRDGSGRAWTAKVFFAPTADPQIIKCTHAVWCNQAAVVHRFEGPMTNVGDGSFGTEHGAVVPPTDATEARADGAKLARGGPSDRGAMAVASPSGGLIGLLWDPNQAWSPLERGPHSLFCSPNRLARQQNHYLSLLVPRFAPSQAAWTQRAATPYRLRPGEPLFLRSELFCSPDAGPDDLRAAWQTRFGDPNGPGHHGNPLLAGLAP